MTSESVILLSNDDGIRAPGLITLHEALSPLGKVVVVAPMEQYSASGKALSFDKPVRYQHTKLGGLTEAYMVDGTPADALIVGLSEFAQNPNLVVSGINSGENTSVHSILTSGTCAIAFEASISSGVPAIAFSKDVESKHFFSTHDLTPEEFIDTASICQKISQWVLDHGLPEGVAWLNVNFPREVSEDTPIMLTRVSIKKFNNFPSPREDPRGKRYFWIWGDLIP